MYSGYMRKHPIRTVVLTVALTVFVIGSGTGNVQAQSAEYAGSTTVKAYVAAPATDEPEHAEADGEDQKTPAAGDNKMIRTGDTGRIKVWVMTLIATAVALSCGIFLNIKRFKEHSVTETLLSDKNIE